MIRRPPRSTRTDTLFPTRRSSDLDLAAIAFDRIGMAVLGIMGEMRLLPEHRADARHLEHQPLPAERALHRVFGEETAGLLREIEQDRARLPQHEARTLRAFVVDDHRGDRKSTRLNACHDCAYRMPSSD